MAVEIIDKLIEWDYLIWLRLNAMWHTPFLDAIIPFIRNKWTWAPLYLFLLIFMPANYRKQGVMWLVFFLLTFALADYISASIMKPYFQRVRPCNNYHFAQIVHNIVHCGSGYSFPSSHAANHFGLAVFMGITLKQHFKWVWFAVIPWAIAVAYAQVYVGVHYPGDVLVGGILGTLCGIITGKVFNRIYPLRTKAKKAETV